MTDTSNNLPISHRGGELVEPNSVRHPVLRRMTEGLLEQVRQMAVQRARYRLGAYELREPDYRLICLWANDLSMAPQALLDILVQGRFIRDDVEQVAFAVEDGAIISLVWDFDSLPRFPDLWVDGLSLQTLAFIWRKKLHGVSLVPKAPSLRRLCICPEKLASENATDCHLDLSGVQNLTVLECYGFGISKLDLSPVPGLTELGCSENRLTELDLSPVPGLTELWCWGNQLTELDLSPVPGLTVLRCWGNQFTELDLSPVPGR
ncbi:MAG: leucine-rich repeat domain-containing protein, partial [Cupriavidus sp.]|nr:leucine-rich repeat domain-containing protein [Cupriavidus sp.]